MRNKLPLSQIHLTPSQMNSHFHFEGVSFTDYIQSMCEIIRKARVDLSDLSPEKIQRCIEANAPSEYRPKSSARHGILLVHGLSSSPVAMASLQNYFGKQGYLTRSILLPGHGTRPGDLLDVTYQDWLEACRFGIKTLREDVEYVTVVGFSAGTAIATYLSLTENSIDSLVLFAPAVSLKNPLIPLVPLLYSMRHYSSKANWPILQKETDYAKYQSLPINAVYQITTLINLINRLQKKLTIPIYLVSTADDETISHEKAVNFFLQQPHPLNRGIIYSRESQQENLSSLVYRQSCYSHENILDFSHVSLAIGPDHFHYGKNTDFADFTHYRNSKKLKKKPSHIPVQRASISSKNLKNHYVQRLSFNPDFDYLIADIDRFLKECF